MPRNNEAIADIFGRIADLLEIQGDPGDTFRVRAYRAASVNLAGTEENILSMNLDELNELPGIGKDLSQKILEFKTTGKVKMLEDLKKHFPRGIFDMLQVSGLGPKHTKLLWKKLKVTSLTSLRKALKKGLVAKLPGFGEKSQAKLLAALESNNETGRIPRSQVVPLVKEVMLALLKMRGILKVIPAGSFRRQKPTVHDLDFIVCARKPSVIAAKIAKMSLFQDTISVGDTKVSGHISRIQCDIRVVPPESLGAALVYFTGSKGFNIYLRKKAIAKGLKLNEYGIFDKRNKMVAGKTEEEIFSTLGVPYLKPERRENY